MFLYFFVGLTLLLFCRKRPTQIRCDFCQHACHVAHAVFSDPDDSSNNTMCCLDHLIHHRNSLNLKLSNVCVHVNEYLGDFDVLMHGLSQRLSILPTPVPGAPVLVRPFPIATIVDKFIAQKKIQKSKAACHHDLQISDSSRELSDDPCSILPLSFQHRPFWTALRMNHLKEFRVERSDFFEGSFSLDEEHDMVLQVDIDAGEVNRKRDRDEESTEKSIDRDGQLNASQETPTPSHLSSVVEDVRVPQSFACQLPLADNSCAMNCTEPSCLKFTGSPSTSNAVQVVSAVSARGGWHSICLHQKRRSQCKDCGGRSICQHGRLKSQCKDCGGSSICQHNRRKTICKECGGSSICQHGRVKYSCKDCGGFCEHRKRMFQCNSCKASPTLQ